LQALLGHYTDVFPEELPKGLPPEISIQLSIKLLPDSLGFTQTEISENAVSNTVIQIAEI
jgi:hypothetical protein